MKKILTAAKLSRVENYLSLYFIFIPLAYMVFRFLNPLYNPARLAFIDGTGFTSQYDDLIFSMLWGVLFLIVGNVLTTITALRYRKNPDNAKLKKFFIAIYALAILEFYNRFIVYFIEDTPFSEVALGTILSGVLLRTLFQGALFIWLTRLAWKRISKAPKDGSVEAQLAEIESLKEKGLIDDSEYSSKRSAILS